MHTPCFTFIQPILTNMSSGQSFTYILVYCAKGHRLPERLVCNRQQWAHEGLGACKITSIALRRSIGGSSAS